jgi:hypothetical protein
MSAFSTSVLCAFSRLIWSLLIMDQSTRDVWIGTCKKSAPSLHYTRVSGLGFERTWVIRSHSYHFFSVDFGWVSSSPVCLYELRAMRKARQPAHVFVFAQVEVLDTDPKLPFLVVSRLDSSDVSRLEREPMGERYRIYIVSYAAGPSQSAEIAYIHVRRGMTQHHAPAHAQIRDRPCPDQLRSRQSRRLAHSNNGPLASMFIQFASIPSGKENCATAI